MGAGPGLLLLLQERLTPLGATAPQPVIRQLRHMHATRFLRVEGPLGPRNMPSGASWCPRAWHIPGALPERSLSLARPHLRALSQWGPTTRGGQHLRAAEGSGRGRRVRGSGTGPSQWLAVSGKVRTAPRRGSGWKGGAGPGARPTREGVKVHSAWAPGTARPLPACCPLQRQLTP